MLYIARAGMSFLIKMKRRKFGAILEIYSANSLIPYILLSWKVLWKIGACSSIVNPETPCL